MWSGYSYPVKNIQPRKYYYFLTSERTEKGFFKFYSADAISVTSEEIKKIPEGDRKPMTVIPREFIDKLKPSTDFTLKVSVSNDKTTHHTSEFLLGTILTKDTLYYPEYMTHAIMSGGEPCLDLNDRMVLLNCNMTVHKFNDPKSIEKLVKACNEAVSRATRCRWAEFTLETPEGASNKVTVKVSVSLSDEVKKKFTSKEVGAITLHENPPPDAEEKK